ncbi:MAG: hypothetical protein IT428_23770 [Planctomycetaceae bacterium]|nr:hypothetical protein [Planctomycetaceae bacterium]
MSTRITVLADGIRLQHVASGEATKSLHADVGFAVLSERRDIPADASLAEACRSLADASTAAVLVLPVGASGTLAGLWRALSPEAAVLFAAPSDVGWLCVRRDSDLLNAASQDALWEQTLGLMESGTIEVSFAGDNADVHESPVARLAPLAPSFPVRLPSKVASAVTAWLDDATRFRPLTPERVAMQAGLLLWHDALDQSHRRSQTVEGEGTNRNADYWHAIMHRREPDYGNSKYWFRAVGRHPVFEQIAPLASRLLEGCPAEAARTWQKRLCAGGRWDAFTFVDLCEAVARDEESELGRAARQIQRAEMLLLTKQTYADAGCA